MPTKVDFDEYIENYNELLKEGTSFFSDDESYFAEYKIDLVRQRVDSLVKRILEFGCGLGRNIPFLRKTFPESTIVGTDIAEASLEIARKENPGVDFLHETSELTFPEPFDLIFVAGVFHHVPPEQRAQAADNLYSRLATGGRLFVFEHNPYNPVTRKIVRECPYDEDAILLKARELKEILQQANLNVDGIRYCLFIPPKFSKLAPVENFLRWLPLGGQYCVDATKIR